MKTDILILSNAPGEVSTWVKPVVKALRAHARDHDQLRISVMLSPCPHASGGEADSLRGYPEVDRVQAPQHFFWFLLTGKTVENWDWHPHGAVVFLGGDQFYAVAAAKRLGYRTVIYAEWEARWASQVTRFGVMQPSVIDGLKPQYRPKATVVGDLMADVKVSLENLEGMQTQLALTPETELIGLLPGSKGHKVKVGVPLMLAIANYLQPRRPHLRFVVPVAPTLNIDTLTHYADVDQNPAVSVMQGPKAKLIKPADPYHLPYLKTETGAKVYLWSAFPALDLLAQCRLCLTTVGANTAQLGALAIPMFVLLPTQQLDTMRTWDGLPGTLARLPGVGTMISKIINRIMIRVIQNSDRYFAWPNIWANREVVPELLGRLTAETVGQQVLDSLAQPETLSHMQQSLRQLRGPSGAATRMAEIILDTVDYPISSTYYLPPLITMPPEFQYPNSRKVEQVDTYHGVTVPDPYRWLEDPNADDTQAWVEAQNEVSFGYLKSLPGVEQLRTRLTELWNYERFSTPFKRGGRYFFYKNDGLQNQSVLYTLPTLEAQPTVLLDPNTLSADGTVALSGIAISENGQYLAYGLSSAGSDWMEWRVRMIETGEDLNDSLKWIKFSGASWTHDNQGFFYSRYDEPKQGTQFEDVNYYQKLFYHQVGTPQSADVLIYERPDQKEWGFSGNVTDDGRYLLISVWRGTEQKNLVFYKDLQDSNGAVIELISDFEAQYGFINNEATTFWFQTDLEAPKGRVIAIDITQPDQKQEIIPEAEETLESVSLLNHQFVADYLKDAYTTLKIFDLKGNFVRTVELPGIGSAGGFDGKKDDINTFYSFTSFTAPSRIYRYNMETGESTLFREATVNFDPSQYETQQVFYTGKDGTRIPMFITYKKGLVLNGQNPTLLYGYGGFNISLSPSFSVGNLVWLEQGGIYAVANLRGGGEYGEEWHQAGTKLNKQNVFDDFIAAAEWLIDNCYTASQKLAIMGGSNGGLLVGACITQRPDLFAAALPAVGVMDMLRFNQFTIGWAWESDYGSPQDEAEFKALYAYSPLHNLKPGTAYPATLITTADHDDRVVPAHSFKFAAALQATHAGENPVMIRIETKAGHGAGKPTAKIIEEIADKWAFLANELQMEVNG